MQLHCVSRWTVYILNFLYISNECCFSSNLQIRGQRKQWWTLQSLIRFASTIPKREAQFFQNFRSHLNTRRPKVDEKQVPYYGTSNIMSHRRKFSRPGFMHPWSQGSSFVSLNCIWKTFAVGMTKFLIPCLQRNL